MPAISAAAFAPLTTGTKKLLLGVLLISNRIVFPLMSSPPLRMPLLLLLAALLLAALLVGALLPAVPPPQAASNAMRRAQKALITAPRGAHAKKVESLRCLVIIDLSLVGPLPICSLIQLTDRW